MLNKSLFTSKTTKISFFFICCLYSFCISGQVLLDTVPAEWRENYPVKFVRPIGFELISNFSSNKELFFVPDKEFSRRNILPMFYYQNKDSSIQILFEIYADKADEDHPFRAYHLDFNYTIFHESTKFADTTAMPFKFYSADSLIPSNADRIVEFNFKDRFLNDYGYKKHRNLYYLKNNKLYIRATYLFRDSTEDIDKVINQNKSLVQFIDDNFDKVDFSWLEKRRYVHVKNVIKENLIQNPWSKGAVYDMLYYFSSENFAYKKDSIIVSVQFPINKSWPYFNSNSGLNFSDTTTWSIANDDFKKYLKLAKGSVHKILDRALSKVNADEGYVFDFSHDKGDFYRKEYQYCRVVLLNKKNVGSILLKYYYLDRDKHEIDHIIQQTLGDISFLSQEYLDTNKYRIYPY